MPRMILATVVIVVAEVIGLVAIAYGQSPRDQLRQLTEQLQKNPSEHRGQHRVT